MFAKNGNARNGFLSSRSQVGSIDSFLFLKSIFEDIDIGISKVLIIAKHFLFELKTLSDYWMKKNEIKRNDNFSTH